MKRFVWLLLIVLSVAGVWSAGWFFAAGQVQQALAMLEASDGVSGPQLTCAQSSVSGFPFRIDIACEEAVLVLEDTTFAAGGVRVSVQADNPTHVLFSARSPITTDDAFYGQSTRLAFAQFQGSARIVAADLLKGF